ncbi:MAG: VWA domain-containing protein [Phycisphaerales bacterium]|nr:VWA domain-containing protein [Phycisphaerales bacterium]
MISTLHLSFDPDLPTWLLSLCALVGILTVFLVRTPVHTSATTRALLRGIRMCLVATALVMIAGPTWTRSQTQTRTDVVPVLLDHSGSMAIQDTLEGRRIDAVQAAADQLVTGAKSSRHFEWYGFSDTLEPLRTRSDGRPFLPEPAGGPTQIGVAIESALDRVVDLPVSGLILMTDGRGPLSIATAALRQRGVGVWVVPIGDSDPPADIRIAKVSAPAGAFADDPVPIDIQLDRSDEDGTSHSQSILIKLTDVEDGRLLESSRHQITPGGTVRESLSVLPELPGRARWLLEIVSADKTVVSELIEVEIHDRPMRVLYLEGRPRVLYRFLGPMLTRERSIDVSILLQSADEHAAPEGNTPIRRLPAGGDELDPFDLILIGDVDPRGFTESQLSDLREHVLEGAGLLWIPGSGVPAEHWIDTPLAGLLPVSPSTDRVVTSGSMQLSPEGESLGLALPDVTPIEWAHAPEAGRPQARALLEMYTHEGRRTPGLLLMPAGRGRSAWLATDDVWRWPSEANHGSRLLLSIARLLSREVAPEEPVLRVKPDPALGRTVSITLQGVDHVEGGDPLIVQVHDERGVLREEVALTRDASGRLYQGQWKPMSSGQRSLQLSIQDHLVHHDTQVHPGVQEDMRLGADIEELRRLAEQSGGSIADMSELGQLLGQLPHRSREVTTSFSEGPALSWPLWLVFTALAGAEWALRRWSSLA